MLKLYQRCAVTSTMFLDVSALPNSRSISDHVATAITCALAAESTTQLQVCACIMLGISLAQMLHAKSSYTHRKFKTAHHDPRGRKRLTTAPCCHRFLKIRSPIEEQASPGRCGLSTFCQDSGLSTLSNRSSFPPSLSPANSQSHLLNVRKCANGFLR